MIEIIKELNIEVSKPNVFQAIVAKQYDMNTRFVKATFVDDGEKIYIDHTADVKVVINALRPDGEAKGFDGKINDDGTVTVPLHSWMLELVGTVTCDISVIDMETDDNKKLTTTSFTLLVEKAAWGGDGMTNDPQYNLLIELLNKVDNADAIADEALEKANRAIDLVDGWEADAESAREIVQTNETIIAEMNGRLDEAIAMRSADGAVVYTYDEEPDFRWSAKGTITTNGAVAKLELTLYNPAVSPEQVEYWSLPDNLIPISPVLIESASNSYSELTIYVEKHPESGKPVISIENMTDEYVEKDTPLFIRCTYDLADVSISEVADIRVGADGTVYDSAGTAVREQVGHIASETAQNSKLIGNLSGRVSALEKNGTGGGSGSGDNVLEVTYDGETCSEKASAIWYHVSENGGRVVMRCEGDRMLSLVNCNEEYALFMDISDDPPFTVVEVGNDDVVLTYEWRFASSERVQDMDITQEQRWTDEQKEIARQNIGAVASGDLDNIIDYINDELADKIGDIDTALDAIIAMQEQVIAQQEATIAIQDGLIGGDGE